MADWHVPGAAVGVIAGGEVVLAKGYGVRDSESQGAGGCQYFGPESLWHRHRDGGSQELRPTG